MGNKNSKEEVPTQTKSKVNDEKKNKNMFLRTGAGIAAMEENERTKIEETFFRLFKEFEKGDIAKEELFKMLPNLFEALKNEEVDLDAREENPPETNEVTNTD